MCQLNYITTEIQGCYLPITIGLEACLASIPSALMWANYQLLFLLWESMGPLQFLLPNIYILCKFFTAMPVCDTLVNKILESLPLVHITSIGPRPKGRDSAPVSGILHVLCSTV
jgi:hypothetical protein